MTQRGSQNTLGTPFIPDSLAPVCCRSSSEELELIWFNTFSLTLVLLKPANPYCPRTQYVTVKDDLYGEIV